MHSAPAVSYPAGTPSIVRRFALAIWTAGWVCCLAASGSEVSLRGVALVGVSFVVGAVVQKYLRRQSGDRLHFDGQQWSLSGDGSRRCGRVQVCLDFQSLMLLRLVVAGRSPCWRWVESHADDRAWRDLRRAVYSRAPMGDDSVEPGHAPESGGRLTAFR